MSRPAPMCYSCSRFRKDENACAAFPEGIPDVISENVYDHRKPLKGDHGLQFELAEGSSMELIDFLFEACKEDGPRVEGDPGVDS